MAFWATQFHKSDADNDLSQTIDKINEAVAGVRVVLGNGDTENTVLHDLKSLKRQSSRSFRMAQRKTTSAGGRRKAR